MDGPHGARGTSSNKSHQSANSLDALAKTWPTPDANVMNDGEGPETFFARQERQKAKGINGNGMGMPLTIAATTWPTPSARDWKGSNQEEMHDRGTKGPPLNELAVLWYTPNVPNGGRTLGEDTSSTGITPDGTKRQVGLENQARWWPTPTSLSYGESHQPGNSRSYNLTMELAEPIFSLRVLRTSKDGSTSLKPRRSLNPLFVEWLMGWPPGWTLLAWTDFACSATELSAWKQRMRSALLQLGLPPEAPLVQSDLFA
jgi:hypothetical protein